jgi:hypothetical protein
MRTKIFGLNDRAKQDIGTAAVEALSGEEFVGVFEDVYQLMQYTLPNGKTVFERLQVEHNEPFASAFFALQRFDGSWVADSMWTGAEIEAALGNEMPVEDIDESCASG